MPIRAALALAMAVAGVVLLVSFKTPNIPAATPPPSSAVAAGSGPTPDAATPAPGAQYRDGSYTGDDMQNPYGDVQVKAVISGGRITDVVAVQLPSDRARSAEISQAAGPMLHDEALQAQSAQIDLLSGATFTSDGYQRSLQSALDQAHA